MLTCIKSVGLSRPEWMGDSARPESFALPSSVLPLNTRAFLTCRVLASVIHHGESIAPERHLNSAFEATHQDDALS